MESPISQCHCLLFMVETLKGTIFQSSFKKSTNYKMLDSTSLNAGSFKRKLPKVTSIQNDLPLGSILFGYS